MYDDPPQTVEAFCKCYVEPMAEESDNIHIVAITDALEVRLQACTVAVIVPNLAMLLMQIPVTVVYLDRSGAAALGQSGDHGPGDVTVDVTQHAFVPESCAQTASMRVHVLYRPGHYDIIYKNKG